MIFFILAILLLFSCNESELKSKESIHSLIDNKIEGDVRIEIFNKEKPSIFIKSDFLHQYNGGGTLLGKDSAYTLLFGGVYADLYNRQGMKASEMYSDSAIIFANTDSVKALGNVEIHSVKGYELKTDKLILFNDSKLVKSDSYVSFTSNDEDWLSGKGFWSNFDMTNFQILKPKGMLGGSK
jgi:LPS export ABC transporter protein LptC